MQIAQVLAGYSLGRADLLRRAMGKKNKEIMDKEKAGFVEGCVGKGVDAKTADGIFELIAFFAGYGFNRSHSAAYGWVTYQTAYLKHHYPHEFFAGLMSCDADNIDNIVKFTAEARAMGLTVEQPDVEESASDFTVRTRLAPVAPAPEKGGKGGKGDNGKGGNGKASKAPEEPAGGRRDEKVIRFGLGAVKGVGSTAVDSILEARKTEERFASIYDFCRRVDTQKANRRTIEQLVKSGAFDGIAARGGHHRAQILAALDSALEQGAQEQRDKRSGQTSLFGLLAAAEPPKPTGAPAQGETYPEVEPWTHKQLLAFEKEALGFYVSGHPLDRYRGDLMRYATATTLDFVEGRRGVGEASVGGIVAQYREMITKKGDKMARFVLEDASGGLEVIVFPKSFEKVRHVLVSDEPILVTGEVRNEGTAEQGEWKIMLNDAVPIADLRQQKTTRVDIHLNADTVTGDQLAELRAILANVPPGSCQTVVRLRIPQRSETVIPLGDTWQVAPSDELVTRLEKLFGERVATFA